MKKSLVLAVVALLGFAAVSQASVLSFSWGTPFLQLSTSSIKALNGGTTGSIAWYVDDVSFGALADTISVTDPSQSTPNSGTIQVTELTIDKWLSKSVAVGLGIGTAMERNDANASYDVFNNDGAAGSAVDIRGTVQLLSGKGDKINGSLDFNISERIINVPLQETDNNGDDISHLTGTLMTLSVTLGL